MLQCMRVLRKHLCKEHQIGFGRLGLVTETPTQLVDL